MYFDTSQVYGCSIYLLHTKGGMASSEKTHVPGRVGEEAG